MSLFLTIAAVHLIALLSPGPDFFYVSQTAISRSRREALAGVAGITLGVAWWAALALAGLQLLLHRVWWLQQVIAIGGGLYLGWMGYKMLRGALRPAASSPDAPVVLAAGAWRALRNGLLTNLANPKVVIYFGSIFSGFIGDRLSGGARWGLWTLVVLETLAWFALVAALFALPAMRRSYLRVGRWIDGGAGAVFLAFGLHLIARSGS
jgi:threonine efflux protein